MRHGIFKCADSAILRRMPAVGMRMNTGSGQQTAQYSRPSQRGETGSTFQHQLQDLHAADGYLFRMHGQRHHGLLPYYGTVHRGPSSYACSAGY